MGSRNALIAVSTLLSWGAQAALAQDPVVLEGRVFAAGTAQPLPEVKVTLLDSGAEALTSRWGVYRLVCATDTDINVRLALPGYATVVERVTLSGNRTIADFEMSPVDAVLDALFVTEPAPEMPELGGEGGLAFRTLDLGEAVSPAATEVLKTIPGVLVLQTSGQVGAGTKIQLRGIRSLFSGSEPLVYVDGVRMTGSRSHVSWVRGESALDLVPPSQIERIEVFKGPAATARFGTGALPGVIRIYTKKGPAQKPK